MLLISWLYPLTTMHRLFKLCARWQHLYQGHFSFIFFKVEGMGDALFIFIYIHRKEEC